MKPRSLRVLLVDDDPLERRLLKANIGRDARVCVQVAADGEEALAQLSQSRWDAVLTDVSMPGMSGIELVRHIRQRDANLPVVMFTGSAAVDGAVAGMRAGANDYLIKPINAEMVVALLQTMVRAPDRAAPGARPSRIVGSDPRLEAVRTFAGRIARVPYARVLITGQSGTGKSLLAREIHDLSDAAGDFVAVNCAALPGNLLESELFGYEKGAFTDARSAKKGLIETARDGTLFLDEIGALPLELQAKLLLFLENHEVRRLGGVRSEPVRTRVVAATNEDLHERVRDRTFRADLLYRLDVASVTMPALAEMPAVIPELLRCMVGELSEELGRPEPRVSDEACAALADYSWPGNVRELRNAVERALVFHDGGELTVPLPTNTAPAPASFTMPFGITLEELERRYIEAMIAAEPQLDYVQLAPLLGISRKTLWEKRRRYQL